MGEHEKPDTAETTEPAVEETHAVHKTKPEVSRIDRFKSWYVDHKIWTIPASVLVFVLLLVGIPATRYGLAGLAVKRDLSVRVYDATAKTPVSGALVSAGGVSVQTDGSGIAKLPKLKAGHHNLLISKKYYSDLKANALVPILGSRSGPWVQLNATGRQVKITVANLINKKPLSNVDIAVADITAKTDKNGNATIVLPAGKTQQSASLKLDGYIGAKVNVKISNSQIQQNTYNLTPSGKVYFLSKLSGKIDVVKTNLDGTDRQTVLAGTGNEDDQGTVLLASRDWKYLALLSRRAGSSATLYLIDTSDDSLTTIDEGTVDFELLGWSDNYFSYIVSRPSVAAWQPKAASIKSYNAQTKQLAVLDSTDASGTSNADAQYETYIVKPVLLDDLIVYAKTWYKYPGYLQVGGQSNTLNSVHPDNSNKKQIKSLDSSKSYFGSVVFHTPSSVYIQISNIDNSPSTFYELGSAGTLTSKDNLTYPDLFAPYPSYLFSPSDKETFWTESRDGKNTLFIGDDSGLNGKQIATLSDYSPYGWYTDDYLLVSKNSSELYIMARGGDQPPIKVSDYHKPDVTFNGYGGGYGGL